MSRGAKRTTFKLAGTKKMQAKLEALSRRYPNKMKAAVRLEAEIIMTDSKRNFVPVDLGILRSSGRVGKAHYRGRQGVRVGLRFGGAAAPYAIAVHEHPSDFSPPSWEGKSVGDIIGTRTGEPWSREGRGAKYLERPIRNATPGLARRLAQSLQVTKP